MITKTGLIYSDNEDLSVGTYSGTIEEDGEVNSINLPDFPINTTVYCQAYCIDDGERIESDIENYTIMPIEWFGIKNEYSGTNTVSIVRSNNTDINTAASYLEYSKNGEDWTRTTTSTTVTLNNGETLYIRGDDSGYLSGKDSNNSTYVYWTLRASRNHSTVGNIMTLLKYTQTAVLTDYSFYFLFSGDTKLISPPVLPATTLAPHCYNSMFMGCTGLTTPPSLPATTLSAACYNSMFSGCTGLTSTPSLPATTLASGCYSEMFSGCTGLTSTPLLPATTITDSCYTAMFANCTALTIISSLPATTLASHCYDSMFRGCTGLTTPPSLPATTLASHCYNSMFEYCTGLTTSPVLIATTLVSHCYYQMFNGCTSLNSVTTYADTIGDSYYNLYEWLKNVANTGTFHNLGSATYTSGVNGIPSGWTEYKTDYFYVKNTYNGTNTITFTTTTTDQVTGTYADSIEYSKDKINWTTLTFVPGTPQTVTLNQGEKLYLRNSSGNFNSTGYYTYIKGSESHDAGGDIMTLVDYTSQNPTVPERCFYYLFFSNTGLESASLVTMPSTTNSFSFTYMFRGCTALTTAPTLPATTLFSNCYNAMFQGCTALTTAPALPATTLGGFCYRSMFYGCTALTTAPALPATTLVSGCYRSMFNGCTSLTAAPVLPATTLVSSCYYDMFNGCTSLNEVTTYADDISATDCTQNWLFGVANSGTFYNYGSATYTSGASGIPSGWTEVNS